MTQFDPTAHPRAAAGAPTGGQFSVKPGGAESSAELSIADDAVVTASLTVGELKVLTWILDPNPCRWNDKHDCQTHGFKSVSLDQKCPNERAEQILDRLWPDDADAASPAAEVSADDQAAAYLTAHPRPDGDDFNAVVEWENGFLNGQTDLPDEEYKSVLSYAVNNAHTFDHDVLSDPDFLEACARNEYLLERLRATAEGDTEDSGD